MSFSIERYEFVRGIKGFTHADMARKLNIDASNLRKVRKGKRAGLNIATKINRIYGQIKKREYMLILIYHQQSQDIMIGEIIRAFNKDMLLKRKNGKVVDVNGYIFSKILHINKITIEEARDIFRDYEVINMDNINKELDFILKDL